MPSSYDPRLLEIANDLLQQTKVKTIVWKKFETPVFVGSYFCSFSGATVWVRYSSADHVNEYNIVIMNQDGIEVARGRSDAGFPREILEALYEAIEAGFMKIDETLNGILEEIKKKSKE